MCGYIHTHTHTYTHIHTHTHTHTHIYMYVCIYLHVCMCVYILRLQFSRRKCHELRPDSNIFELRMQDSENSDKRKIMTRHFFMSTISNLENVSATFLNFIFPN
ncbi:unnamed protein product [Meganyctiphanes norvegica]|uniref:Uncharacterized protein n=1 Tax=Meganyctiphanes norvegica TaxID=48144 RepID=A0AAV2RV02_MEGNR